MRKQVRHTHHMSKQKDLVLNDKNKLDSLTCCLNSMPSLNEPVSTLPMFLHICHMHLTLHKPPLALLPIARHLHVRPHTPWYEQWGPTCTHQWPAAPLQHDRSELPSAAWWHHRCQCCGAETPSWEPCIE